MTPTPGEPPLDSAPSGAGSAANPPPPGPGIAPGNTDRTAIQSDPGSIGGGTAARPERYLVIARHVDADGASGDAAEPRYLCARWPDWPYPTLVSLAPPAGGESLTEAVDRVLGARLGARATADARLGETRVPARMPHPRTGVEGLGWLRPVAVTASGEPAADALLAGLALLTAQEALGALSTDVERAVFSAGLALFD